jgi:photosystem II stability/assembly factor-like uncharacterized protein/S-formylglutathione hydrolase FrmB
MIHRTRSFSRYALLVALAAAPPLARPLTAQGTTERIVVHGPSLAENLSGDSPDREVSVYLPPSYATDAERRYPVLYLLHGYTDTDAMWFGLQEHWIDFPPIVDRAVAEGAREMIVVMPNAFTRFHGSMYSNSVTTGNWEDFVARDLVASVDARYRTLPDAASRGIAGHSMGGYGAMRIGMRHPDVFSSVYLLSPCCMAPRTAGGGDAGGLARAEEITTMEAFEAADFGLRATIASAAAWAPNPDNPPFHLDLPTRDGAIQPLVLARIAANAPLAMVDQYVRALAGLRGLGFDAGDEDRGIAATVRELDRILTAYGVPHESAIYPGDHLSGVAERIRTVMLPFFSGTLAFDEADADADARGGPAVRTPAGRARADSIVAPSWEVQHADSAALFIGLAIVDSATVWAAGTGGRVARTVDGGATWSVVVVPGAEELQFRDVEAFSEREAFVLSIGNGPASRIYRTGDGGATWTLSFENQDSAAFFDCFSFWDRERGFAFSDSHEGEFTLIRTLDGGDSWQRVDPAVVPDARPGEGAFAASGTCVATRPGGLGWFGTGASGVDTRVIRTSDFGATWQEAPTPIASPSTTAGIFSLAFLDDHAGVAAGGDDGRRDEPVDQLALTEDGGVTWTLGAPPGLDGAIFAVAVVPGTAGPSLVAVNPQGSAYSNDGGRAWTRIDDVESWTVAFRGAGAGWAAGRGHISRFRNAVTPGRTGSGARSPD